MNGSSNLAADIAAAERRLEQEIETWNPRAEGMQPRAISGALVERRLRPGRGYEGADAETVLIESVDGKLWLLWLFGTVLQQDFAGLGPGDIVAVKYEGHADGGRGSRGYERFRVSVVQQRGLASAAPTVSSPAGERAPEPAPASPGDATPQCEACRFYEPHHADGCPNDIPF